MNEEEALRCAIAQEPYDVLNHRALADYLDENDRPEEARFHRLWTPQWQRASDHVRDFCLRVNLNHAYFLREAARHLDHGGKIGVTLDTSNATGDLGGEFSWAESAAYDAKLTDAMRELWHHVGVVLRREVGAAKCDDPFTCGNDCFPDGLDWEGPADEC